MAELPAHPAPYHHQPDEQPDVYGNTSFAEALAPSLPTSELSKHDTRQCILRHASGEG